MPNDNSHLSDVAFSQLSLHPHLKTGLDRAGFEFCTPIQAETLPFALQGKDIAGQAQTGTGKTAAFLLATLHHLLSTDRGEARKKTQIRALILAPTRELAIQIHKDAVALTEGSGLTLGLAYGGTDYDKQRAQLASGVDILIGTPGRIIDYFKQKVFDLNLLQVAVMDEADRMFDLGFIKDVRFLFRRMPDPNQRLNLLFSATLSCKVTELAYEHMNDPILVKIEPEQVTAEKVVQQVYYPADDEKIPLLIGLLKRHSPNRSMVFVNTKRNAEKIDAWLRGNGYQCAMLSGDVPQKKREKLMGMFQAGDLSMLVTTDVAARGLHIDGVTHVFNYDLPQDAEDYVHRIGRTARAGATGVAMSFACEGSAFSLPEIEAYIGFKLPYTAIDADLLVVPDRPAKRERPAERDDNRRGRDGNRNSSRDKGRGGSRSGKSASRSNTGRPNKQSDNRKPANNANANPSQADTASSDNPAAPKRKLRRRHRRAAENGAAKGE